MNLFTDDESSDALIRPTSVPSMVRLAPGRSLTFSPEWDCSDARVVFDRNSGDYWVVSQLAAMALGQFQQQSSLSLAQLENGLSDLQIYADLHAALALTLQSLIDNDLLENANHAFTGGDVPQ